MNTIFPKIISTISASIDGLVRQELAWAAAAELQPVEQVSEWNWKLT